MSQWLQQNRRIAKWLSASVVAGACLIASPHGVRSASAEAVVEVRVAPPATRVEVVPARPSPRHFWVRGYWAWNGRSHVWMRGHYEVARPGYAYRETHWESAPNGHFRYHQGGWYRR